MRYKAKSSAALHIALGGLPAQMPVKVDADIEVTAKTVGELRKVTTWPENLAITTPQDRYPDSAVRVSNQRRYTHVAEVVAPTVIMTLEPGGPREQLASLEKHHTANATPRFALQVTHVDGSKNLVDRLHF